MKQERQAVVQELKGSPTPRGSARSTEEKGSPSAPVTCKRHYWVGDATTKCRDCGVMFKDWEKTFLEKIKGKAIAESILEDEKL